MSTAGLLEQSLYISYECCMSECIDHRPCVSREEAVKATTSRRHAKAFCALKILGSSITYMIAGQRALLNVERRR